MLECFKEIRQYIHARFEKQLLNNFRDIAANSTHSMNLESEPSSLTKLTSLILLSLHPLGH